MTRDTDTQGIVWKGPDDLRPLLVPIDHLEPLPGNPRRGDIEAVARSLERFGQRKNITRRPEGITTAGNHTRAAALLLGWTHVAVVTIDEDDVSSLAWSLADNRTSDLATNDEADLAAMLASIQAADASLLADASWAGDDLQEALAAGLPEPSPSVDPNDVPPLPRQIISQAGDVWLLGRHRLVVGDCTDVDVVITALAGEAASCVWTDPPYGVEYESAAGSIQNDGHDLAALETLLRSSLGNALACCRPGGAWYVAGPAGPNGHVFGSVLAGLGVWRHTIMWVKDQLVLGRADYHYRHEQIFASDPPDVDAALDRGLDPEAVYYGWRPGAAHHPVADRSQTSVWEFPKPRRSDEHPTMKPVELVAKAIANSTRPGQLVLDVFAGSGTTLIACEMLGRRAGLVELDPGYADVIVARWETFTGQKAERVARARQGVPA